MRFYLFKICKGIKLNSRLDCRCSNGSGCKIAKVNELQQAETSLQKFGFDTKPRRVVISVCVCVWVCLLIYGLFEGHELIPSLRVCVSNLHPVDYHQLLSSLLAARSNPRQASEALQQVSKPSDLTQSPSATQLETRARAPSNIFTHTHTYTSVAPTPPPLVWKRPLRASSRYKSDINNWGQLLASYLWLNTEYFECVRDLSEFSA